MKGLQEKLIPHIGKEIIFGFRPEYLYDKVKENSKQLSVDLPIIIDVTEPVGSEAYNYFHFIVVKTYFGFKKLANFPMIFLNRS